jgi:hypothetical protein
MELFAGSSVCVLVLTSLLIAIKTFAVWRRTKGLPELLLGTMLVSATVLGYPVTIASTRVSAAEMPALHIGAQTLFSFGYACLMLFTLRVFRPDALWAKCLAAVTVGVLVFGVAAYVVELSGEHPRDPRDRLGLTLLGSSAIAVAYFWTMLESLAYHRRLRLRLRLGLADVVVANRVLLWGLMSLAAALAVIVSSVAMVAGSFLSAPIVLVCSLLGLAHAGCLFLAFHPPAGYRRWLEQGAASAHASL